MAMEYPSCIEPPKECPNENVTFWLYTRTNQDNPHQLRPDDDDSIKSAPWVQEAPIKILIHGYTGNKDYSPNSEIRPAYMECCDYNVISVDYNPIALEPCYQSAAKNTELVGMCTAQLIDKMVQTFSFDLSRFHVIGFSLGGHAAGQVGKHLRSGRLDRITGLDPALPLFVTRNPKVKLSPSDATFVDVLHTNALERGKVESCGHVDFYANGGLTQPGCYDTIERSKSSCDHARAPAYYAESINTDVGFYGTRCFSWIAYMIGWCELNDPNEEVLYGEYVPLNASGLYFFSTNSKPPYARGRNKMQTEGSEY
ncbi:pancreatic lipase-related protein 3-like [Amyelois transitella]|uniref:pancreatic lipase-related protein 3-like n=1 Tax=Amyelois transitella TaxID=680683 RepID=UPI002990145E|nr:pancreatic lipase-related protein 3-like [Amyelois transitella]